MKFKTIINSLLCLSYLISNSQELVEKTDVMKLSLNKRPFIQKHIVDGDTTEQEGYLIELFDKTNSESGRLIFNGFDFSPHKLKFRKQFDMIADLVYKKDEKKVFFVMAEETGYYGRTMPPKTA